MFGKAPLISCILLKPIGSQFSPRAASGFKLRDVEALLTGAGAKAAAEPARAVRRASFMVVIGRVYERNLPWGARTRLG